MRPPVELRRARRTASRMEFVMARRNDRMETIVSLAKRRGFVFPSSEIYGGLAPRGTTDRWAWR